MKQKLHSLVSPFILINILISTPSLAGVVSEYTGRVNMQGAIIDTPCSISPGRNDQTIDMGSMSIETILKHGHGNLRPFTIELKNCNYSIENTYTYSYGKKFHIGFDGLSDGNMFGLNGEAQGVALQILNEYGNVAFPGEKLPIMEVDNYNMKLNFLMKIIPNKRPLIAGSFYTTVRFNLDYY